MKTTAMKTPPKKRLAIVQTRINGVYKTVILEPLPKSRTLQ